MQHTNYPNRSVWNPLSRNGVEPSGFVAVSNFRTPYMRAALWTPVAGTTAVYDPVNTYKYNDVSTRKQGGWIAAVPHNTSGIVLFPFDKDSGFGDKEIIAGATGQFIGVAFSSDGNYLLAVTSSAIKAWNFTKTGIGDEVTGMPALRVSAINGLEHNYELDTFLISGNSTPSIELRSFDNLSEEGRVNNVNLTTGSNSGSAITAISGVQASGKRYWAFSPVGSLVTVYRCYYGQIDNRTTLTTDGYVDLNTNESYHPHAPMFFDEGNALYLGQSTDPDDSNAGRDYLGYVLPSGGGNLTGPQYSGATITNTGSSFTSRQTNGGDGGSVIATLRWPGADAAISGLNYGWDNTRGLDASVITSAGFGASLATPFSMGAGSQGLDWF